MKRNRTLKTIAGLFRGTAFLYPKGETFRYLSQNFTKTVIAIRGFYLMSLIMAIFDSSWWWPHLTINSFQDPLWPLGTLQHQQLNQLAPWVFVIWIGSSLLAFYRPQSLAFRVLQFTGVFYAFALYNSDGHYGHSRHAFLWVSFALVFLNLKKTEKRIDKFYNIQIFWAAQFIVCSFYFMTGLWKVISLGECVLNKDLVCELSHKMLTNISAQEFIEYEQFAPLRMFLFDYPWIGFVSYMGTIWIHLSSIHFAFRSDIHSSFGVLRVIFHLGTFVLFGVNFTGMTAAVVILYLVSPFSYPSSSSIYRQIFRLPIINEFLRITKKIPNLSAIVPTPGKSLKNGRYVTRLFYGSLCYLFAHDTTWAWKNLYNQSHEMNGIVYFAWHLPLSYLRFIDITCYGLIISSFLVAALPKTKLLKWAVPVFYLSFLGLWNFEFRNLVFDLSFLILLLLVPLATSTRVKLFFKVTKIILGSMVGISIFSNIKAIFYHYTPQNPSLSYILNILADYSPTAYFLLNLALLSGAALALVYSRTKKDPSLVTIPIVILAVSQLILWKDGSGVYLLPIMLFYLYAPQLVEEHPKMTRKALQH